MGMATFDVFAVAASLACDAPVPWRGGRNTWGQVEGFARSDLAEPFHSKGPGKGRPQARYKQMR
jgi:hypothetical protein